MSLFEDSDEEYVSPDMDKLNKKDSQIKFSEKGVEKGRNKQLKKREKLEKSKKKNKETSKKKQKNIENKTNNKKIIDLEKRENEISFCEDLFNKIEIKKINPNGISKYDGKNKIKIAEDFYDRLFKNDENSKAFIAEIEKKLINFHDSESIFKLYSEMILFMENTEYYIIKNWLFYHLVKDFENRYNDKSFDIEKLNIELIKKYDENVKNRNSPKKRKRSFSNSEDKKSKKKKYDKEKDKEKEEEKEKESKKNIEKPRKDANKKKKTKKDNNKEIYNQFKGKIIKDFNYQSLPVTSTDKNNNKFEKNTNHDKISNSADYTNQNHIYKEINLIQRNLVIPDNQSNLDPVQELIRNNTLRINNNKQKSQIDNYEENTNQLKNGWNFNYESSSREDDIEKEADIVRLDLS